MATVQVRLVDGSDRTAFLSQDILALIHLRLTTAKAAPAAFSVTLSPEIKWNMQWKGDEYVLNKITLQIGYADSQGMITCKNSGLVINGSNAGSVMPLIWNQSTGARIFSLQFLKGKDRISIDYKILFEMSDRLPKSFNDTFTGKEDLLISNQDQTDTLKIYLQ